MSSLRRPSNATPHNGGVLLTCGARACRPRLEEHAYVNTAWFPLGAQPPQDAPARRLLPRIFATAHLTAKASYCN
jgi:hypothetical protein